MSLRLIIATCVFVASAGLSQAQSRYLQFEQSIGLSEPDFTAMEAQTPDILKGAPPSSAAEKSINAEDLRFDPKIVGGTPFPKIADHPWQVALIFGSGPEPIRVQFCGGSLIGPKWVMTAAHCVDKGTKPEDVDIILGTAFYKNFGERLKVKQVVVHENWNSDTMENDIALLELEGNSAQGHVIDLVAANHAIEVETKLRVTGWGALTEGGRGSEILMGADIPAVSNETCEATESYGERIKPGMMCAGLRGGGLDSCQGDSGGPAVVTTSDGKYALAGVVSWGSGCARRLKYGVYTSVASYRSWIDGKLKP